MGLGELAPRYPPLTLDQILGSAVFVRLGNPQALPQPDAVDALRETVLYGRSPDVEGAAKPSDTLPLCGLTRKPGAVPTAPPGRWVRIAPTAGMFDHGTVRHYNHSQALAAWATVNLDTTGFIDFSPPVYTERIEGMAWRPYTCRASVRSDNVTAVQECIRSQPPIAFRGDSQTRTLFNSIMARFAGKASVAEKHVTGEQCVAAAMDVCFTTDIGLEIPLASLPQDKSIVMNCGHHALAHCSRVLHAYKQGLEAIFSDAVVNNGWLDMIKKKKAEIGLKLAWLETVPYSVTYFGYSECGASRCASLWL